MSEKAKEILEKVRARDPNQTEFLQAVEEVIESLEPLFAAQPKYLNVRYRYHKPPSEGAYLVVLLWCF